MKVFSTVTVATELTKVLRDTKKNRLTKDMTIAAYRATSSVSFNVWLIKTAGKGGSMISLNRDDFTRKRAVELKKDDKGLMLIRGKSDVEDWAGGPSAYYFSEKENSWGIVIDDDYKKFIGSVDVVRSNVENVLERKELDVKNQVIQIQQKATKLFEKEMNTFFDNMKKAMPSFPVSKGQGLSFHVSELRDRSSGVPTIYVRIQPSGFGETFPLKIEFNCSSVNFDSSKDGLAGLQKMKQMVPEMEKGLLEVERASKALQAIFDGKEMQALADEMVSLGEYRISDYAKTGLFYGLSGIM